MKLHYYPSSSSFSHFFHVPLPIIFFSIITLQFQQSHSAGNETDRLALLEFKQGVTSDPHGVFNSWNDTSHFCNWFGVSCSRRHQRVVSLVLKDRNLKGFVSPYVGNLSFLRVLDLQNNSFYGRIPSELGNLFRLEQLHLHNNLIGGEIPANLSRCSQLRNIFLQNNNLSGKIPGELGGLTKLEKFSLEANNLIGEIPVSLGNISSLVVFFVLWNHLTGKIPDGFGKSANLNYFSVAANHLSGIVPPSIFNCSSLITIFLAVNEFHGKLPDDLGLTLPNIREFGIGENNFSGSIPSSLSNASRLEILDIGANDFVGQVPNSLGKLQNLWLLDLSDNELGNNLNFLASLVHCRSLTILDLSQNSFGGVLPDFMGNLSTELSELYIPGNQISGTIPVGLENLKNLMVFSLERNFLIGNIPSFIGKLQKLQGLSFRENRLSGLIPSSIGNLTNLFKLDLSDNRLEGSIPDSIANCRSLQQLDISHNFLNGTIATEFLRLSFSLTSLNLSSNFLSGNLPVEIGKLTNINLLDVSENRLSGEIPEAIGECSSLEYLYMQGNAFQGGIPETFSSLKGLQELDLSRNNLTGEIPRDLQNLSFIQHLNLTSNDLEGEVPTRGIFTNASLILLDGNYKLCGGLPELHLPKCLSEVPVQKQNRRALKLALIITSAVMFVILVFAFLVYQRRKTKSSIPSIAATSLLTDPHVQVSYHDLHQATGGFSLDNLIGSGSFGSVYKGYLHKEQKLVAIKVLKLEQKGALKSFIDECKALRGVRHRNLVKLLTYCSSLDYKRNEFKALVFEFMENGSLEKWLERDSEMDNQPKKLNFLQRLNVSIDIASALHYLHDLCETSIVHRDLKPSNILLDDRFVARLSDFGLAKLYFSTNDASQSQMSSIGVKGTIGYAPPEYGMGGMASKEGDVYSFGILVLELFSGKKPTDNMFTNGLNLHEFVKNSSPDALLKVVDSTLSSDKTEEEEEEGTRNGEKMNPKSIGSDKKERLLSILRIGVECSTENPKERMKMGDVVKELHLIRSSFLGVRIYG